MRTLKTDKVIAEELIVNGEPVGGGATGATGPTGPTGSGGGGSSWTKYDFDYTDFAAAAVQSNTVTLFTLAAGHMIEKVVIKHDDSFSGASIDSYTVSVGFSGNPTGITNPFDIFQSPGNTVGQVTASNALLNFNVGVQLNLYILCTGGDLDAAVNGQLSVWVKTTDING